MRITTSLNDALKKFELTGGFLVRFPNAYGYEYAVIADGHDGPTGTDSTLVWRNRRYQWVNADQMTDTEWDDTDYHPLPTVNEIA